MCRRSSDRPAAPSEKTPTLCTPFFLTFSATSSCPVAAVQSTFHGSRGTFASCSKWSDVCMENERRVSSSRVAKRTSPRSPLIVMHLIAAGSACLCANRRGRREIWVTCRQPRKATKKVPVAARQTLDRHSYGDSDVSRRRVSRRMTFSAVRVANVARVLRVSLLLVCGQRRKVQMSIRKKMKRVES